MMKPVHLIVLIVALLFSLLHVALAEANQNHQKSDQQQRTNEHDTNKLRAQSRTTGSSDHHRAQTTKKPPATDNKAVADMHSVYQQHLIGSNIAQAISPHDNNQKNEKKDIWSRFGQSKEAANQNGEGGVTGGGKRGRLQTVGSVIGDIIGVLVSEIARFFGSVVSDVAREVTAHGFVSLFKQIADFTGLSFGGGAANSHHAPPHSSNTRPVHS